MNGGYFQGGRVPPLPPLNEALVHFNLKYMYSSCIYSILFIYKISALMKKAGRVSQQTRGSIQRSRAGSAGRPQRRPQLWKRKQAKEEEGGEEVELEQEGEESRDKEYEDEDFGKTASQDEVTTITIQYFHV